LETILIINELDDDRFKLSTPNGDRFARLHNSRLLFFESENEMNTQTSEDLDALVADEHRRCRNLIILK